MLASHYHLKSQIISIQSMRWPHGVHDPNISNVEAAKDWSFEVHNLPSTERRRNHSVRSYGNALC